MAFSIREASPQPLPITRRPRPNGVADIVQVHIHSTRGPDDDGAAGTRDRELVPRMAASGRTETTTERGVHLLTS